jgi:hypothetical protein
VSEYSGGESGTPPGGRDRNTRPPGDSRGFFGNRLSDQEPRDLRPKARSFFSRVPGYNEIETEHDRELADHYLWAGWFDPFATTEERNTARQEYYELSFTDGSMFPWNEWHREVYGE